jgi:hypothetical protein
MLTKDKILRTVQELPDHFSIDELLDRILLLQKIEIGREQSQAGLTYSTEEAKAKLARWLK